jgi:hypothetical protein
VVRIRVTISTAAGAFADPKLRELTLDAPVAPAGILPSQAKDQSHHVIGQWRTATATVGLGPFAGGQSAVAPQDRARRHQEDRPAPAGKRPAQQCEQRTIGGMELGPPAHAAQHLELVAQDRDLDIFGVLTLAAFKQHADEPAAMR